MMGEHYVLTLNARFDSMTLELELRVLLIPQYLSFSGAVIA